MSYQVVEHKHGVYVLGPVPVSEILALAKIWEERGLDLADQYISGHYGASWCQTTREGSKAWRAELGIEVDGVSHGQDT